MNAAHQASRRRRPLLIVLSVALVIALVIAAILWRDRFGDGQQEAEDLAAALPEGDFADEADVAEHQRILGPLIEATGQAPQVELADAGSAEDGQRTATLEWTWTLPEEAGTWEFTTEATLRRGDDGWSAELDPGRRPPGRAPRTSRRPRDAGWLRWCTPRSRPPPAGSRSIPGSRCAARPRRCRHRPARPAGPGRWPRSAGPGSAGARRRRPRRRSRPRAGRRRGPRPPADRRRSGRATGSPR